MSRRTLILAGIALVLSLWLIFTNREQPVSAEPAVAQTEADSPLDPEPAVFDPARHSLKSAQASSSSVDRETGLYRIVAGTGDMIPWTSLTPASKRSEVVHVNAALLTADPILKPGDQLEVTLEGRGSLVSTIADVRTWGNGTVAVTGTLPDNPHSRLFLSYTASRASMLIQDRATDTTYKIEYVHDLGEYVALEVDYAASDILGCGVDELVTPDPGFIHRHEQVMGERVAADSPLDMVTLDILVVYTAAAKAVHGDTADVENAISMGIQLGNDTHGNSDTRVSLNFIHTEEVSYLEEDPEDSGSPSQYLNDLTNGAGLLSGIPALRDTHEADFVVLIVDTSQTGGLGWNPTLYTRQERAFSIVRSAQVDTGYTLVHEIGHNMTIGHSLTQTSSPYDGAFYLYAAGWQWADATVGEPYTTGFCTVMTYENFDNDGLNGFEYMRVPHFSNPDISYNSIATGDIDFANAAQVIRNGRFEFAGFRGSKPAFTGLVDTFSYQLDFETYTDCWYQPDDDTGEWDTISGPTPDRDLNEVTGPLSASSGDYYMYIESSENYSVETEHVLQAKINFTGFVHATISFDYHMYLASGGNLYLEASTDNGSNWSTVWSKLGDQGDGWKSALVDLSAYDGMEILLRFRGVTGIFFLSDIALDNFKVSSNSVGAPYTVFMDANYPGLLDKCPTSDPDMDGMINFLEYAFGMLLDTPDADAGPSTSYDDVADELSISFKRAQAGVRYLVESTDDLDFAGSAVVEWDSDLSPPDLVPVGNLQTVDVAMPVGGELFLQVEATE